MRTLLWKELRIVRVCLVAMIAAAIMTGARLSLWHGLDFFYDDALRTSLFLPAFVAGFIAIAQWIQDVDPEYAAFGIHRGVSRTKIFQARTIAALVAFIAISLVPILMSAAWFTMVLGVKRFPFEWPMLLPSLVGTIGGFGFYFATTICMVRKSGAWITRWLPLALPVLGLAGAFALFATDERVPWPAWLCVLAPTAVLAVIARGLFVANGNVPRASLATKWWIGTMNFAGFAALLGCIVIVPPLLVEPHLAAGIDSHWNLTQQSTNYFYAKDGSFWRSDSARNFFESEPTAPTLTRLGGDAESESSDGLQMTYVRGYSDSMLLRTISGRDRHKLLTPIRTSNDVTWLYSARRGLILGYADAHREAQLVGVISPGGFHELSSWPTKADGRFGALRTTLAAVAPYDRTINFGGRASGPQFIDKQILLFEDGIYEVDFTDRAVTKRFDTPGAERLISISELPPTNGHVLVATDRRLHVFESFSEVVGGRETDLPRLAKELGETSASPKLRIKLPAVSEAASPFTEVQHLDDGAVVVRVKGKRYQLKSINGAPVEDILKFCRKGFGRLWQKRFDEDLPAVMIAFEKPLGETTDVEVAELTSGDHVTIKNVPLTAENRNSVRNLRQQRRLPENAYEDIAVRLPGKLLQTIEIPSELAGYDTLEVDRTADGEFVFRSRSLIAPDHARFVKATPDGEVIEVRDHFRRDDVSGSEAATLSGVAPIVPAGPFALLATANTVTEAIAGRGTGIVPRALRRQPFALGLPILLMLLSAVASCFFAKRAARARGLDARGQRIWQVIGLLFGPAAVLAVRSLRPRPVRTACHSCNQLRAVSQPTCQNCGSEFAAPTADGTEIVFKPGQARLSVASSAG